MADQNKTFHLGICMAGAITAGSYTAGVMDYLLETLERWQLQKDANKAAAAKGEALPFPETPMYDVRLDVISGASAGGMCAAIASAMVLEGFTIDELANKKSKMYKSWIELDDDNIPEGTIKKMLETDDIEKEGIVSILNSKVLTRISEKAVKHLDEIKAPVYVDRELDTILTLANLRGTKYSIEFNCYGAKKKHLMSLHRDFMHFKVRSEAGPDSDFLEMNFSDAHHVKLFQESAVATGAFPVGLRPRPLVRKARYYYNKAAVTAGIADLGERGLSISVHASNDNNYHSLNVDGGTFNNEPFGETERVLNKKAGKHRGEDLTHDKTNRTILMIDPFPSNENEEDKDDMNPVLTNVAPRIISALRAQSSFKSQDLIDALSDNNYLKYLIIPSKGGAHEPLCCSTLGAFGGFLYKGFREHDYQLGRRNAQQFLRKHFSMPYSPNEIENNPIHRGWSSDALQKFLINENGHQRLPIIPDVQIKNPASEVPAPLLPKYPVNKLEEIEELLSVRISAILDEVENMSAKKSENETSEAVKEWFKQPRWKLVFKSIGGFLGKPVAWVILRKMKKEVRKSLVDGTIKWILKDLEKAGLLGK